MTSILSLVFWLVVQQQPLASIDGTAVRAGTAESLSNLRVELWPPPLTANTDAYGKFKFQGVEPGNYTVFVESNGIRNRTPLQVLPGQRIASVFLKVNVAPTIYGTIF